MSWQAWVGRGAARCEVALGIILAGCGGRSLADSPSSPGAAGAATSSGGSSDSADDASPSGTSAIELARSTSRLEDVFVGERGIYLLFSDEVRLLDHQGALLKSVALDGSSEVAGSFDEERLTVASGSVITTYEAQLAVLNAFPHPRHCVAVARFSKERILCAAWYYGYTVLDGASGNVLSDLDHQFFSGAPLARVPGRDEFLLNGGKNPLSNVSMLALTPDNQVSFLSEATLQQVGLFNVYGFDGGSTPSLIGDSGQQVGLRADCAVTGAPSTPCFVPGAPLGSIPAGHQLEAIAPGPTEHQFFGLVDTQDAINPNPCEHGCELELIDDLSGVVLRQRHVDLVDRVSNVLAFRWDERAHAVVLAVSDVSTEAVSFRVILQPL